jgi:hypothetical protein
MSYSFQRVRYLGVSSLVVLHLHPLGAAESTNELLAAAEAGDLKDVQRLLSKLPDGAGFNLDATNPDGFGQLPLQLCDRVSRSPSVCSETALMLAARSGVAALVTELLERGAAVQATNAWGDAALVYSAEKGFTEITKALILAGADVDALDKHGQSPFDGIPLGRALYSKGSLRSLQRASTRLRKAIRH